MLEICKLKKTFGKNNVLKGIDLTVSQGENVTIIGESGSGKSTILKLILQLISSDSGDIRFNGVNIPTLGRIELNKMRLHFGLLFQSAALFDSLTVEDNVGFSLNEFPSNLTLREKKRKVNEALDMVEMIGTNKKFPSELSGGQQKRIGLARAIITRPQCLLFDEPTTGLDPVLSTNIEDLMVRIAKELNTATIIVTHQISTILRTSDLIYYLHEGELLDPETPSTIHTSKNPIIKAFIHGETYDTN